MKIRLYMRMENSVYHVLVATEDWSRGDIELMEQFGEPDVNVGGEVGYSYEGANKTKMFGDEFVKLLHGFPFDRGFDARDYDSTEESVSAGVAWKEGVVRKIESAVLALRANVSPIPTEEVKEV